MKKKFLMIAFGVIISGVISAQEYKVSKSTGTLDISEVGNVLIEGYAGNEIVFSSRKHGRDDDRAKGLRAISSMGLEDNTGIGLSVVDKGQVIEVRQLKKADGPEVLIKVPKGVKVSYSHTSPHGDEITVRDFEGEVEISTVHNDVRLTNITGPMNVKTVHGDIEAVLGAALKNPVVIHSVHGHVDVALPVATKANLRLGTSRGEILVDPDFKIEIDRSGNYIKYNDKVSGKLNGGGTDIDLSSVHDNVYLRKK
jgi:predicted membrane protein